ASIGRPLPQALPEVRVGVSDPQFTPDGSGPTRNISIYPKASADAGILSWKQFIRDGQGVTVRKWEGNGTPPNAMQWEGLGVDGKPLPVGTYSIILEVVDLYGNDATSPAQTIQIVTVTPVETPLSPAIPAVALAPAKPYTLQTTAEGLRVT